MIKQGVMVGLLVKSHAVAEYSLTGASGLGQCSPVGEHHQHSQLNELHTYGHALRSNFLLLNKGSRITIQSCYTQLQLLLSVIQPLLCLFKHHAGPQQRCRQMMVAVQLCLFLR